MLFGICRSKEVGHFEKLQEATEERLRLLAPESRVLLTPEPVSSWNDLNTDQQDELKRDFLVRNIRSSIMYTTSLTVS